MTASATAFAVVIDTPRPVVIAAFASQAKAEAKAERSEGRIVTRTFAVGDRIPVRVGGWSNTGTVTAVEGSRVTFTARLRSGATVERTWSAAKLAENA